MAKGHGKGGQFERDTSRMLSMWLSNGEDDSWVWRTSQSGGRATQRAKKGKKTSGAYGDLTFTDSRAEWLFELFVLELKRGYSGTNALDLIDSRKKEPELLAFWNQCNRDREEANRPYSMVILKRDRKSICCMIHVSLFTKLKQVAGNFIGKELSFKLNNDKVVLMLFEEFLNWLDPETVKQHLIADKPKLLSL